MIDLELIDGLADDVREMLAEERASTDATITQLRAEVADLKEVIASIPEGPPGKDGRDGEDGADGKDGEPGPRGERGEKGMDGRDGRDGKDGRDGVATRDELNELVKTAVEGRVADVVAKAVEDAVAALPRYEYRSVWRDGERYERGNWVTYGGSLWHCDESGTDAKPGSGKGWTLAVKRGRDAREPVDA